jgi:integrase
MAKQSDNLENDLPEGLWKRGDTYYARFRRNGRIVRKRLSRNIKTAKTMLNELTNRVEKGDFGLLDINYPYAELKKEFLAWVRQTLRRPDEYKRHLETIEQFRKINNVREIDHSFAISYREWRLSTPLPLKPGQKTANKIAGPRTVNLELQTLHNMLSKAVKPWKRIGANPLAGLEPLSVDKPKKKRRSLSADEIERIFEHSPEYLKPVWRLFAVTGVRHRELTELLFTDIDFAQGTITIRAEISKNHEERIIPIDDDTLGMLRILKAKATSNYVFVSSNGIPFRNKLLERFYTVCKKAGIEGGHRGGSVDIHSLRKTFITLAIDGGASPKAVQEIVGHSTLTMTMNTYAEAKDASKRKAVHALPFVRTQRAQVNGTENKSA